MLPTLAGTQAHGGSAKLDLSRKLRRREARPTSLGKPALIVALRCRAPPVFPALAARFRETVRSAITVMIRIIPFNRGIDIRGLHS
jgi:hypothetical protein